MGNNWKEKIKEILHNNAIDVESFNLKGSDYDLSDKYDCNNLIIAMVEFGNLVFEATKKECADKANLNRELEDSGPGIIDIHEIFAYDVFYKDGTVTVNKDSILNINKPNL